MDSKNFDLYISPVGTYMSIDIGDVFFDITEMPRKYRVANNKFDLEPNLMLCIIYLIDINPDTEISDGDLYVTFNDIDQILEVKKYDSNTDGVSTKASKVMAMTSRPYEDQPVMCLRDDFVRAYIAGGMDKNRVRFNGNIEEICYLSEDGKVANEIPLDEPQLCMLREIRIDPPSGKFILEQTDITPIMTYNGAYYHYVDVCKLLKRKEVNPITTDAIEFMMWTYRQDQCPFIMDGEDLWYNQHTGKSVDTYGLYNAFLQYKQSRNDC